MKTNTNIFKKLRFFAYMATMSFILLAIGVVAPYDFRTDSASAAVGTAASSTLNLTVSGLTLEMKLRDAAEEAFAISSNATIGVSTNNVSGYTLSIATNGESNEDKLINTNTECPSMMGYGTANDLSSKCYINSIVSAVDATGFENLNLNGVGRWGYRPSQYVNGGNTVDNTVTGTFLPAPTGGQVLAVTNAANAAGTTDEYTMTLGVKIDYTVPAGTYANTFVVTAVGNSVPYNISFSDNTGDSSVASIPAALTGSTLNTSISLPSATPTRSGYDFAGWCLGTVSGNGKVCTGTIYSAGASFGIDQLGNNIATLYALWEGGALSPSDCPANSICYAPNASDIGGTMVSGSSSAPTLTSISASPIAAKQTQTKNDNNSPTNITSNSLVTLIAPNYYRSGYGFAGWSTDYEATTTSTIYGPNETITVGDLSTNGMILYPVWVASTGNLQNWTGCSSLTAATYNSSTEKIEATLNSVTGLTDTRDGNVYAVARLTDGFCWMIENLRLDAENSRGSANIAKAQGYASSSTYGNFIGLADSESANFEAGSNINSTTVANSIYYAGTQSGNASINIMLGDYAGYRMPRYNNNNTNVSDTNLVDSHNGNSSGNNNKYRWYGYGNYYTWAAAMASTKYYTSYNGNGGQQAGEQYNSDTAGTSICPKGWELPLGASSNENISMDYGDSVPENRVGGFSWLDRTMGGRGFNIGGMTRTRMFRVFPNNYVFSGTMYNNTSTSRGGGGTYFTRSAYDEDSAYLMSVMDFGINVGNTGGPKTTASSVRCMMR